VLKAVQRRDRPKSGHSREVPSQGTHGFGDSREQIVHKCRHPENQRL